MHGPKWEIWRRVFIFLSPAFLPLVDAGSVKPRPITRPIAGSTLVAGFTLLGRIAPRARLVTLRQTLFVAAVAAIPVPVRSRREHSPQPLRAIRSQLKKVGAFSPAPADENHNSVLVAMLEARKSPALLAGGARPIMQLHSRKDSHFPHQNDPGRRDWFPRRQPFVTGRQCDIDGTE